MENSELLPCPFCGSSEIHFIAAVWSFGEQLSDDRVECQSCEATIHDIAAITVWNTRTPAERVTVEEISHTLLTSTNVFTSDIEEVVAALKERHPQLFKE